MAVVALGGLFRFLQIVVITFMAHPLPCNHRLLLCYRKLNTDLGGDNCRRIDAGLPDIQGNLRHIAHGANIAATADGAFKKTSEADKGNATENGSTNRFYFQASRYCNIYGNSDTVQPPALSLIPQIKY